MQQHFYNGKKIDYDLSMLNAYESADLIQSKDLKRSLFKTKDFVLGQVTKSIKKAPKEKKKEIPFPKLKIKGIAYSSIPKAILLIQNKERIVMEGEKVAKWELTKIYQSELLFTLNGKKKRIPFGAQEFSQGSSQQKSGGRRRFGSGPSGFPR